ncbi:sugar ABC transporter permease [candidate division WOR-3 bacterium JGI_Cruoil_03_44_89]|uniref:Sugar ABC transporter permease n=1 Tax=candidate division WOR-3 bacterium JGI_Cruoil_03_44_89 TaxID=1973748 RepID=A0A235BX53_UNCW3|nr:MAG: sugar ABC transporter permease [candidate division WOR-3 bacterium JGI_Cruoil_03_44_89]
MRDFRRVIIYVILIVAFIATLTPFAWMAISSFKTQENIFTFPPRWIPEDPTVSSYLELFQRMAFPVHLRNSIIVTVSVTILVLFLSSLSGYAFAKLRFPGRQRLFVLFLVTMMVPAQVTTIPVFLLLKRLGLLNNYLGLILPAGASAFGIFLLRQYMQAIPDSLLDAARIDGCSEFRIYRSIVLPLCMPAIAALAIFTFMGTWNDFFWPLIIMTHESMYTLPVALANLNAGQYATKYNLLMAGSVVVTTPVVLLFVFMQRYFIQGIALTGMRS